MRKEVIAAMSKFKDLSLLLALAVSVFPIQVRAVTTATIVGDSTGCFSSAINADITSTLGGILTGLGYSVTTVDLNSQSLPSLTGVTQVWDLRCTDAISGSISTSYQSYVAGGGSLFLLGEAYQAVQARDDSIGAFIQGLGGGTSVLTESLNDLQNVLAPFTGPIAISTVQYNFAGSFTSYGTGSPVSQATTNISTVSWPVGSLSGATAGTVVAMLDVNPVYSPTVQASFVSNIASYLASPNPSPTPPTPPRPIPTLTEWAQAVMMLAMIATAGFYGWRMKQR
jgi:hypothetical protein